MTEAPKRIHVRWGKVGDTRVTYMEDRFWPPDCGAEYILAAEHDRIVAEKDAEITRLREALLEIEGGASPDHWVPQFQHCVDVAREAMKGDSDE